MTRLVLAVVLLLLFPAAIAETITYEIYEVSNIGSRLIAKGERHYSLSDVTSRPYERDGRKIVEKFIELEQGYRVGARIFFPEELTGFGLLARHSDHDFSWEWYKKESGNRFRKLQGGTAVEVNVSGRPSMEELAEVTFLDDTALGLIVGRARIDDAPLGLMEGRARDDTHKIIVKAGSVLRFKWAPFGTKQRVVDRRLQLAAPRMRRGETRTIGVRETSVDGTCPGAHNKCLPRAHVVASPNHRPRA